MVNWNASPKHIRRQLRFGGVGEQASELDLLRRLSAAQCFRNEDEIKSLRWWLRLSLVGMVVSATSIPLLWASVFLLANKMTDFHLYTSVALTCITALLLWYTEKLRRQIRKLELVVGDLQVTYARVQQELQALLS